MSDSISLPSLLIVGLLSFLLLRYIAPRFSSSSSSSSTFPGSPSTSSRSRPIDLAKIEQVAQMFPQLDRRAIAWDLGRNGGNVGATTERVLTRGSLELPPPSYQPPGLTAGSSAGTGQGGGGNKAPPTVKKKLDLIERYGLAARVNEEGELEVLERSGGVEGKGKGKGKEESGWAKTKDERAALLKRRREDMILQARRRMVEKEKGKGRAVD
ncbi:MAG: hypothetical protein MMC23_006219 [Stictis urceolatum]|nr:hypothetical protein [Stictis urceolata]